MIGELGSTSILFDIALMLVFAKFLEIPFRRYRLNPIPAYIISGFILGPYLLGILKPTCELIGLAYLGLILLMLYTGLTTEFHELKTNFKLILIISVLGVIATFTLIYLFLISLGYSIMVSIFVAVTLSNTATETVAAIVSRKTDSFIKSVVIGASFVDDVIAVFLITFLTSTSFESFSFTGFLLFSIKTLLFLVIVFYLSYLLSSKFTSIYRYMSKDYFWFASIVIMTALVLAVISRLAGLSELIGAYLAGILISRGREYHDPMLKTRVALSNFIGDFTIILDAIFLPLFFAYIGLSYSIGEIDLFLYISLLLLAIAGKVLGATPYSYIKTRNKYKALSIGFAMSSRGSLEIVLLKLGLETGVISHVVFSTVLTVAITTTLISPILYTIVYRR